MSLTIAAGTPTVPLFLKAEKLSFYKKEEEIVLPPFAYVFRARFKPIEARTPSSITTTCIYVLLTRARGRHERAECLVRVS